MILLVKWSGCHTSLKILLYSDLGTKFLAEELVSSGVKVGCRFYGLLVTKVGLHTNTSNEC